MTKLWQKGYRLHEQVERFESAQNSLLDNRLIRHDVWGSLAHSAMLKKIGILSDEECGTLHKHLCNILRLADEGDFTVTQADEDVHTCVENYLTEQAGEAGKNIHTARSRNDQVLLDLRLYGKEQLNTVAERLSGLCQALLTLASEHADTPMPGYTHMQRAMLSSVGLWAASFAESLLDDEQLLATAYQLNDQSPLGSAAGYGVPLAIDRQYVADLLGFERVQNNVIYAQNSRGKIEGAIVQVLMQIMLDLSKFAQDVLLFTTLEYGFFQVPQELCVGSSIMPQKRNVSVMELVRARTATMLALQQQILGIVSGLPSGFNMDYQETKRPFMDALDIVLESLEICTLVASNLSINTPNLVAACTFELFAADSAYEMAASEHISFRDAYRIVGKEVTAKIDAVRAAGQALPSESLPALVQRLHARAHLGGAGNLGLEQSQQRLEQIEQAWHARSEHFATAIEKLLQYPQTYSILKADRNLEEV
ncbi:MAG: argininosuccinate lyase [Ktedonobacteraceae bacterium]